MRMMILFLDISFSSILSVMLMFAMLVFCMLLILRNMELKKKIEEMNLLNRNYLRNNSYDDKKDIVSMESISGKIEEDDSIKRSNRKRHSKKKEIVSNNIKSMNIKLVDSVYKNDNSRKSSDNKLSELLQMEPIKKKDNNKVDKKVGKNALNENSQNYEIDMVNFENSLDEFVMNRKKENNSYLDEVSKLISQNLEQNTIELTDYEQEQEDNAIISYRELIGIKDKLESLEDDEVFLDELKKFRNSLD